MLHLSAEEVHTQMRNSVIPHPNSVIPKKVARFVLNRFLGPKKWSSGYGKKNCIKQLCYATGSFHLLSMTGQTTISDTLDLRGGCPSQKCAIWSTNVTDCTIMKCAIWQKLFRPVGIYRMPTDAQQFKTSSKAGGDFSIVLLLALQFFWQLFANQNFIDTRYFGGHHGR